jgi:hypothetical protein
LHCLKCKFTESVEAESVIKSKTLAKRESINHYKAWKFIA